jgi:hypothetical protein
MKAVMSSGNPGYQRHFNNASKSQQPDLREAIRADLGRPSLASQPRVSQRYPATRERLATHGDRAHEGHAPHDEGPSRARTTEHRSARRDDDLRFQANQNHGQALRRERRFRRKLVLATPGPYPQQAMHALLTEKREQAAKLEGIPARTQAAILEWFLG